MNSLSDVIKENIKDWSEL